MKALITGANGYIGKHVVKEFLKQGYEVYVSDLGYKGIDERAQIVPFPIFSGDSSIYEKVGCPDVLVHLAWRNGFLHNADSHMRDLSSHVVFLEDMIKGGLRNITVMGSMHETGYWEGAVDENTPCNPMSMYGIAKNALRQDLQLFCKGRDVNLHWLRAYYIYGDDTRGSSIFAKICQAAEDQKKEFPFTTGKNKYDFIEIRHLAEQIFYASTQDEINGVINVCTGTPVSLADMVENYIKEKGFDIKLIYGAFPDREYDSPGIWGNAEKINAIMEKAKHAK